jgi:hypothetical protein
MIEIPNVTLNEWLEELKPYQSKSIQQLALNNDLEEVAKIWITTQGNDSTVPFGAIQDTSPFWNNFKGEFIKFICDDSSYSEEKKLFKKENKQIKTILISTISSSIGATIGFSGAILAPAIVIMLSTVGSMGINAYCKTCQQNIEKK